MMREITDGLCKFALSSLPFWIVHLNVSFVALPVNCFLRLLGAFWLSSSLPCRRAIINFLINDLQGEFRYELLPSGPRFPAVNRSRTTLWNHFRYSHPPNSVLLIRKQNVARQFFLPPPDPEIPCLTPNSSGPGSCIGSPRPGATRPGAPRPPDRRSYAPPSRSGRGPGPSAPAAAWPAPGAAQSRRPARSGL